MSHRSNRVSISRPPTEMTLGPSGTGTSSTCPAGLEYLASLEGIYVKQLIEMLEIFVGVETNNRYEVLDGSGHRVFFAAETSHPCVTMCGGTNRPFIIQLLNFAGEPILAITRECSFALCCGFTSCGGNRVDVAHIGGESFGSGKQVFGGLTPKFELRDDTGSVAFLIYGPCCADCCCCRICMGPCCTADFKIYPPSGGSQIGLIQKKADMREIVSDANTFGVTFPPDLSPRSKALILGAVFLIDFGYFESNASDDKKKNRHHHHHQY